MELRPTCAWCGGKPNQKYAPIGKRIDHYCEPCVKRFRDADQKIIDDKEAKKARKRAVEV